MPPRKSNKQPAIEPPGPGAGIGAGAGAGVLAGGVALSSVMSGAGGTTVTSCPPGDNSFYCRFVKGFNVFKMILVILVILILICTAAYFFMKKSP